MASAIYLLSFAVTALSLGFGCVVAISFLRLPLFSRFIFGACLTPFWTGGITQLGAIVAPGIPRWLFVLAPVAAAGLVLGYALHAAPAAPAALARRLARGWRRDSKSVWRILLWLAVIATVATLARMAIFNVSHPVIGHDALIYLSEAKAIAETRSLQAFAPGGAAEALLPATHPHTKLFSLYLAHALAVAPGAIGYPDDVPARIAFQLTFALLVLSLAGLSAMTRVRGAGGLAIVAFALFPGFEYITNSSSRDGFRLIPIVVLIGLLSSLLARRDWSWKQSAAVAAVAAFAVFGHTINLYFMVLIAVWFLIAALWLRASLRATAVLGSICAVAVALPLSHYVRAWLQTGTLFGEGMNFIHLTGTPLIDAFLKYRHWGGTDMSFPQAVVEIWSKQSLTTGALTLLALIIVLAAPAPALAGTGRQFRIVSLSIASLAVAFVCVPLSDVPQFFRIGIRDAYLSNARYPFVAFALCVPLIGFAVLVWERWLQRCGPKLAPAAVAAVIAALGGSSVVMAHHWPMSGLRSIMAVVDADRELCRVAAALPPGAIWLTDRYSVSYYCTRRPMFLYTRGGREFFAAASVEQASARLSSRRVALVALSNSAPDWWPQTTLYRALITRTEARNGSRRSIGYWQVFALAPPQS